jgi:polysaccharide biosynthesis transport protein
MADRTLPKKETESEQIVAALGTVFRTRRPLLLACALGVLIPVLAFNELAPPVYEASTSLVFEELASPGEDITAQAAREYQMFNRIEEMNSLAFSEDLARALPESLFARIRLPRRKPEGVDRMELAGTVLHEGVRAFPLRNTNIIRVRARTTDPELSVAVANLAPAVLQARSQRIRKEGATGIRSFVDDQLARSQDRLQESEDRLRDYKEKHGVSSLEGESAETLRKLTDAEVMLNTTRADRGAAERRLQTVRRTLASSQRHLPGTAGTPTQTTQGLKERLVQMESQYAQLSVQGYDASHPRMAQLRQDIANARRTLSDEAVRLAKNGSSDDPVAIDQYGQEAASLQLQVESLRARESALQRTVGQYRSMLKKLPNLEVELARLTRERDANQKTYTSLLDNRESIRVAAANQIPNSRVVDWAQLPESPVFPRKALNLGLGLALGLMLGSGVGLYLESGRSSLRSAVMFEDQTGWPVLARVPASRIGSRPSLLSRPSALKKSEEWDGAEADSQRALVSHSDPASAAGEAYFMLRTRLELLGLGTKYRSIMVTSTAPRDGKSSTLCNLAATFGSAGKSALVIDAELRRPVIHRYFGVNQWPGLSDLLLARKRNGSHGPGSNGSGAHPGDKDPELFQRTKVEGVTVLSCGKRVSEHEWESTRPELGALLNELRTQYDVLLVDSAPPVLVHDTLAICSLVDAVVVVVNSVTYDARQLLDTKRLLEQAGANIVGAVINRVEPYGTYSYYYDRRYGPREPGDSPVTSRA